jgi:hypothetical protein
MVNTIKNLQIERLALEKIYSQSITVSYHPASTADPSNHKRGLNEASMSAQDEVHMKTRTFLTIDV